MIIGVGVDRGITAGRPIYVTDLPGHDGLVKTPRVVHPNAVSDWGWGSRANAIPLSPYWQRRFLKYSREGYGFNGRLQEVPDDDTTIAS